MRILVVVLNWNGIDDTLRCLDALKQQTVAHDVFLLDNGSHDESVSRLREVSLPNLQVHFEDRNKGFAGGVNVGIKHALAGGYEAVALLNNDATPAPDWLEQLEAAMTGHDASIVTGLMLRDDGADSDRIDTAGDMLSIWGMPFPRGRDTQASQAPAAGEVFGASGGASLFRTEVFREIGLFDEHFFAYFEDVDVSFRARLAGHRIFYTPRAVVWHKIGATSGRIPGFTVHQTFKNLPLLLLKNVPTGLAFKLFSRFSLLYTLMLGKAIVRGNAGSALKGSVAALTLSMRYGLRERRRIQKSRAVGTAAILSHMYMDLPPQQHDLRRLRGWVRLGR